MARWAAPGDRATTEALLQRAALELLEANGVLDGLNLREVADRAGVNRGLVYHYFGSRRDLLRSALLADAEARIADFREAGELPVRERHRAFFEAMIEHRKALELMALLALDDDDDLHVIRDPARPHAMFERDIAQGELPPDTDIEALHVASVSLVYGYLLFRDQFARDLGLDADELDGRVAAVTDRLLGAFGRDVP